jgi:hypothetical protein
MGLTKKLASKIPLFKRGGCRRQTGGVNHLLIEDWQLNKLEIIHIDKLYVLTLYKLFRQL